MNKDALLATIIGFGIGLVIAGLVFLGPTIGKTIPLPNVNFNFSRWFPKSGGNPSPTAKPAPETLTVESPLPESIESKNETLISGASAPRSVIVIEGESSETVVVANDDGAYAGKIGLGEGKNTIKVTSYANGKVQSQQVTVYYTPEDF